MSNGNDDSSAGASRRRSIAVLHINGLGDQLVAWPTIRALDHLFPGQLKLALGEGMRFMFYRDVTFAAQLRANWSDFAAKQIAVEPLASELGACERFVNLAEWLTESVWELAEKVALGRSIGLRPMYAEPVLVDANMHMADRLFAIAQRIDPQLRIEDFAARPRFAPAAEAAARALRDEHLAPGEKLLFVHPETGATKQWPAAGYGAVLERFLRERPEYKAFVCTHKPYPIDAGSAADRVIAVDPHLELAMALVGCSDLFLGIDSCFLHAADLYRVPGVSLFGPTSVKHWGFRFSQPSRDLVAPGGNMGALSVDEVLAALLAVAREADQRVEAA
jgi:ADP-heptose:LPS heptosyltransferase